VSIHYIIITITIITRGYPLVQEAHLSMYHSLYNYYYYYYNKGLSFGTRGSPKYVSFIIIITITIITRGYRITPCYNSNSNNYIMNDTYLGEPLVPKDNPLL
jgi:lipoprotein signal peptidase